MLVKADKFFQSATWFSYGGMHTFCPTKMAAYDMSWKVEQNEKVGFGLFALKEKKQQTKTANPKVP